MKTSYGIKSTAIVILMSLAILMTYNALLSLKLSVSNIVLESALCSIPLMLLIYLAFIADASMLLNLKNKLVRYLVIAFFLYLFLDEYTNVLGDISFIYDDVKSGDYILNHSYYTTAIYRCAWVLVFGLIDYKVIRYHAIQMKIKELR